MQVLKTEYFPRFDFFNVELKHGASYTWKSIWSTKKLVMDDLGWGVDTRENISIIGHAWILGSDYHSLVDEFQHNNFTMVSDLIDQESREWRRERILRIPMATEAHDDILIWKGDPTGEFIVHSAYKLLRRGTTQTNPTNIRTAEKLFYRKLWSLQSPAKIKDDYLKNFWKLFAYIRQSSL